MVVLNSKWAELGSTGKRYLDVIRFLVSVLFTACSQRPCQNVVDGQTPPPRKEHRLCQALSVPVSATHYHKQRAIQPYRCVAAGCVGWYCSFADFLQDQLVTTLEDRKLHIFASYLISL